MTVVKLCFGVTGDERTSARLSALFVEGCLCVSLIPPHTQCNEGFSQDQVCKEGSRGKARAQHSGLHSNESETKPADLHVNASVVKSKKRLAEFILFYSMIKTESS